jgi:hypothetical protein
MPYHLSILLKTETSRITYTFRTIFLDILGFNQVDFFSDVEKFRQKEGIKLSYDIFEEGIPFIASASNLLYEKGINQNQPVDFGIENDLPCFYRHEDSKSILPFDFAAMSFWLLTRYEEYQSFIPDDHARFTAYQSFAYRNHFLDLPIIDFWAIELRQILYKYYQKSDFPEPTTYSFQPSFDIDYAWAYRNKPLWRTLGAFLKDALKFNFRTIKERTEVLLGKKPDPYFTFSKIDELHKTIEKPIFFWLLGDYGKFDKNTDHKNKAFKKLIANIAAKYKTGIHPSYASNERIFQAANEKKRLEEISDIKIKCSRQHFLRLKFPETYNNLIEMGISDEYSMGYAEFPGFRASLARSFYWYNLISEQETTLRIHPFMIMDVTLNVYLKKNTAEAFEISKRIIDNCKRAGGNLITIWHNNSLCEKEKWTGWTSFYKKLIDYATKK